MPKTNTLPIAVSPTDKVFLALYVNGPLTKVSLMGTVREISNGKCFVYSKNGESNFSFSLSTGRCYYRCQQYKVVWVGDEEFEGLSFRAMTDLVEKNLSEQKD